MNRREWIGATAGMLVTLPNGVSLAEVPPSSEEAKLLGYQPIWIGCGSDSYYLEWIKAIQPAEESNWYWSWKEKTNDEPWIVGDCMTSEPRLNIFDGKLTISVVDGLELIWNG